MRDLYSIKLHIKLRYEIDAPKRSMPPLVQCTNKFIMEVVEIFPITFDELHEALTPEVCLFLGHGVWMLFFQRQ